MLHRFKQNIDAIAPPERFTWPFHYTPHPLSRMAAQQVQEYLLSRPDWADEIAAGKMFGVLVVRDLAGELGFLAAFSGNLAGENSHSYFVPPVYDMLRPNDFFRCEEAEISAINRRVEELEHSQEYLSACESLSRVQSMTEQQISEIKQRMALSKQHRAQRRQAGEESAQLILESQRENAELQRLKRSSKAMIAEARAKKEQLQLAIDSLREERRRRSAELQMELFRQFRMLNARGEVRDLCQLFAPTPQRVPPAGAGECAAPKLLQAAYIAGFKPICMAEFWQGASPRGEVRHHGAFYPSCNGKCKPILTFMMEGLDVDENPLLAISPAEPKILYEDNDIVAIDKPSGMLSVKGRSGVRSVEQWAEERYPDADRPMIIHRLDQSTSGVLLLAKRAQSHYSLQQQFIKRTVRKRYIAILDGVVDSSQGRIELPMRLDYENRPRQMVAADGKQAVTEYKVLGVENGLTRIAFWPITGRTHQLRLHAAHSKGLATPIVGDDIYGRECRADLTDGHRLMLHAESVTFDHPLTGERMEIESRAEF